MEHRFSLESFRSSKKLIFFLLKEVKLFSMHPFIPLYLEANIMDISLAVSADPSNQINVLRHFASNLFPCFKHYVFRMSFRIVAQSAWIVGSYLLFNEPLGNDSWLLLNSIGVRELWTFFLCREGALPHASMAPSMRRTHMSLPSSSLTGLFFTCDL